MEFDDKETEEENLTEEPGEHVEIYSKRAIWGFSIFFSTIFGGVLLMLNLWTAGFKRAAYMVLLFSVLYIILASIIVSKIGLKTGFEPLMFNIAGGAILTEYFFKKYFPDDDYYPKSIQKPLLISILIALVIVVIMYYGQKNGLTLK